METITQRVTSASQAGVAKPSGVPVSVFEAGRLAKLPRKKMPPLQAAVATQDDLIECLSAGIKVEVSGGQAEDGVPE